MERSDRGVFEPFLACGFAMFAWGRRLGPEERNQLIAAPLELARMLAWCDSCPTNEVASLLDWAQKWKPVLKAGCFPPPPHPEDEFYRRCGDRTVRLREMCAHLVGAVHCFRDGDHDERSLAGANIHRLLRWALRDAASTARCPDEPTPESSEEWSAWLAQTLATSPFN